MTRLLVSTLTLLLPLGAAAKTVPVATVAELKAALSAAQAGDELVLAAGTYKLSGASCTAAGTAAAPIRVRAATPLAAKIEFDGLEGFKVSGPHWRFEDLSIRGVCASDSDCEHAFHVVGKADGFQMLRCQVVDFNAQLKVNSELVGGTRVMPQDGLVEGNQLYDTHARATSNPVTKLNVDNASGWVARANLIYDFHKGGGDSISYGAFFKGGGKNNRFERNLVLCSKNDTTGGTRIGLSFGGGGMSPALCAPAFSASVPCDPENDGGVMVNNIIVNCSDVGIYLNKAKNTKLLHNTLIATTGIDFRFASSTGEAHGNVLSDKIRVRDGGSFTGTDNLTQVPPADFSAMYVAPLQGDLRKKGDLGKLLDKGGATAGVVDDYCARTRVDGKHDWGALEHSLGDCTTTIPPLGPPAPPKGDGPLAKDASPPAGDRGSVTGDGSASGADRSGATGDRGATADRASGEGGASAAESGCGCALGARRGHGAGLVLALLALGPALLRRRRRAAGRGRS